MLALLCALSLSAGPRAVAVLDLGAREGVSRDLAQTLSELQVIEVRRIAVGQRIYGAEDIRALMSFQRQKSLLHCDDTNCLAELGGALGAQEIIAGNLSVIGDEYVLVIRRLEVAKAQVVDERTANVPRSQPGRLQTAVRTLVDQLYGLAGSAELRASASDSSRPSKVVPWVLGAGAAVAAGASAVGWIEVANFEGLRSSTTVTYNQAKSAQSTATVGEVVGIAGAVVAAALASALVLSW